jgi:hypothetical protein
VLYPKQSLTVILEPISIGLGIENEVYPEFNKKTNIF